MVTHKCRPEGRPTKYIPDMCDRVIEMGKYGASKAEMSLELDITYETFNEWEKSNPEFSYAVKKAVELSKGWWEKQGRVATMGGVEGFNATSYIFNMVNRFKEDWKNRNDTNVGGQKDNPIQVQTEIASLTDEQIAKIADIARNG